MNSFLALSLTLALGFFILLGALITFAMKNNEKFVTFSLSMAFGVMTALVVLELFPEALEKISENTNMNPYLLVGGCAIIGMVVLNVLDFFIPDHEEQKNKKDHLHHIGIVSSVALILHNIIEGMAVYGSALEDTSLGLLISIGVGLHNIPLGMVIASTFYSSNQDKRKTVWIIAGISISTFVGGILMFLFTPVLVNQVLLGILLSITLGMLIYIILFELLGQILHTKYKRVTVLGILLGLLILVISLGLE